MTAKLLVNPFQLLFSLIEILFRPFRRPAPPQESETFPIFENDGREVVRELAEREPTEETLDAMEIPAPMNFGDYFQEIRAPKGIALRKSVMFRTHRGEYRSAKVVGWEADGSLILSRKNGPPFRRALTVGPA